MRTEADLARAIANELHFEQVYALLYHERKQGFAVHKRPWYEAAMQWASRQYFMVLSSRHYLEWFQGQEHKSINDLEPPLPAGWSTLANRAIVAEPVVPWRQLVYDFNHSLDRLGCPPLSRKEFYELCKKDYSFQIRWTPYISLHLIDELDEDERPGSE
jgi:hypothetical protein